MLSQGGAGGQCARIPQLQLVWELDRREQCGHGFDKGACPQGEFGFNKD